MNDTARCPRCMGTLTRVMTAPVPGTPVFALTHSAPACYDWEVNPADISVAELEAAFAEAAAGRRSSFPAVRVRALMYDGPFPERGEDQLLPDGPGLFALAVVVRWPQITNWPSWWL